MFSKIFSLSNAALFVALLLSAIAAWYSIIGLTAIFAGAVVPIIIMGSALELAKITTTVWLRKYWYRCAWIMKLYLVPAVVALALLTSMGIFGFLSKAHMDQGIGTGDVSAKVALLDEKIKIQRDNITANRAMLAQMDTQVNDIMSKGDSERSVERSVTIRKQQANERAKLLKDIELANANIQKLNEERAPIASELRKVEAEVGPIKYIAALIYGDNPDSTILERAVRWVIILLVIVFDPLAIMLVLAANQSKDWDDEENEKPKYEPDDGPLTTDQINQINELAEKPIIDNDIVKELDDPILCYKCNTPLVDAPGIGLFCPNKECDVVDNIKGEEIIILDKHPYLNEPFKHFENLKPIVSENKPVEEPTTEILTMGVDVVDRPGDYITDKVEETGPDFEGVKVNGEWIQTGPDFTPTNKPNKPKEPKARIHGDYVEYNGQNMHKDVFIDRYPDLFLKEDGFRETKTSFGIEFPKDANIGDSFVRVDVYPNRTFKYNGSRWIEVTRDTTDSHLTDEYLQYLVSKIATGEYDPELLTPNEQDALEQYIKNPKV